MPPRIWQDRVRDILEAIERIRRYTEGMDRTVFASDRRTIDAVVRNFTVIGEAARHVPAEITKRHAETPWQDMRDIRNVVVHEYFGVSIDILWETICHDLQPLVEPLEKLLAEAEPE